MSDYPKKPSNKYLSLVLGMIVASIATDICFADPYSILDEADRRMASAQEKPALTARGGFESYYEWLCFEGDTEVDAYCDESFHRDPAYKGRDPHAIHIDVIERGARLSEFVSPNHSPKLCSANEKFLDSNINDSKPFCIYAAYLQDLHKRDLPEEFKSGTYWVLYQFKSRDGRIVFKQ